MTAKELARERVDAVAPTIVELSHRIHAHPEEGFQEKRAAQWLADALGDAGYDVTVGVGDLPTALTAQAGSGPFTVAICAEYDALPELGHACGHNIIAAAAVGAAIALRPVADDLGITVRVVGTPAEEFGGGKSILLARGAFDGVHAALMIHPAARTCIRPNMPASSPLSVTFAGRAAHAAAWPERGVNAADAITVTQVGIGLLRQHIAPTDRIHGIVRRGGTAVNVIPDHTELALTVRSASINDLAALRERVEACARAGALATGCSVAITEAAPVYAEMRHDPELARMFAANAACLGYSDTPSPDADRPAGSTDMGNVSQVIPAIHPLLKIETDGSTNHQPGFAACAVNRSADELVRDGTVALAWTAIDAAAAMA